MMPIKHRNGFSAHWSHNNRTALASRNALSSIIDDTTKMTKFTEEEVNAMVDFAEKEQKGYGYFDAAGGLPPKVPSRMNLKYNQ
jgi:hypothetical protein